MRTYTLRQIMVLAFDKGTNHTLRMKAMNALSKGITQQYTIEVVK